MAGLGRSSRGSGKRAAAAPSSTYYVTTGVVVALCIAGVCFLTTSSASASAAASAVRSAAAVAERTTVTAYRHTTRSSFAYAVPKQVATPPREVAIDDPQGELAEHVTRDAAEDQGPKIAMASGADGATEREQEAEQRKEEAVQEERQEEQQQQQQEEQQQQQQEERQEEQQQQQQEEHKEEQEQQQQEEHKEEQEQPPQEEESGGVKEKSLDGGVEEESREGHQRPEEEEQQDGGSGGMRREAQEELQTETEERTEQSEESGERREEERNDDQPQNDEERPVSASDAGDNEQGQEDWGGGDDKPGASLEQEKDTDSSTGINDPNVAASLSGEGRAEVSAGGADEQKGWATQADQSEKENDRREEEDRANGSNDDNSGGGEAAEGEYEWRLCNVRAGPDYIPCLDNEKAIKQLRPENYRRYEHRERHCPEENPTCLVALPSGYRRSIEWPKSRDRIWYNNVPHTKLAEVKGHQNWVKVTGQYLTFPGGGTQFIHGALHYIDFLQQSARGIAWGKHTRVVLDVGCGVASFGGYLFERDVVTMSFAPKDEHEAQVQFALERGIPAISAVMGSKRLPFPSKVFDLVHCARCRVPWHIDAGALLLELNRVLRPGGYFVWSATPVYQKLEEDVEIWKAMSSLTKSMCWDLVTIKKDRLNGIGAAFYRKPTSNDCYDNRRQQNPPMCSEDDDPNAAWYIRLNACMHRVPTDLSERGTNWPEEWPQRVRTPPYWLNSSQTGVYGKAAPDDFTADYEHWRRVIGKSYLSGFGIDWSRVRNVMDMRAVYGGFAAALRDQKIWVMNVVSVDAPDTLPIIFERGLFGIYHDWCESFSTYPRTYDLLHADHLFSRIKERCTVPAVVVEVDRILRPGGKIIVRDESDTVGEVEKLLRSLHWDVRLTFSKDNEGILYAEKSDWRPEQLADPS